MNNFKNTSEVHRKEPTENISSVDGGPHTLFESVSKVSSLYLQILKWTETS